jgi:hypothetical protein
MDELSLFGLQSRRHEPRFSNAIGRGMGADGVLWLERKPKDTVDFQVSLQYPWRVAEVALPQP